MRHRAHRLRKREYAEAYVYIAGSLGSRVVKVGNAILPERRLSAINSRRYGGIRDWVLLHQVKHDDAGSVEGRAHRVLSRYRTEHREIFRCGYAAAKAALDAASTEAGSNVWTHRYADTEYSF